MSEMGWDWLRTDLNRLSKDVEKLDAITRRLELHATQQDGRLASLAEVMEAHERPCKDLREHLENHKEVGRRWWAVLLQWVVAAGVGAFSALVARGK